MFISMRHGGIVVGNRALPLLNKTISDTVNAKQDVRQNCLIVLAPAEEAGTIVENEYFE